MFCTESVTSTLVFTNINGCILLLEVLFFRWLLDGKSRPPVVGRPGDRADAWCSNPCSAPLLLLPLLNRQWRALVPAIAVPVVVNLAALPLVSDPMDFFTRTVPYILGTRDYFNSSIEGNGVYFGLPTWLIVSLRISVHTARDRQPVAAVPLLPHPRPAVLVHHLVGRAAAVVVAGVVAGPGLLLDDAVPVPDDGGAA